MTFINIFALLFRENKTMFQMNPLLGMKTKNQALFSSKDKKLKCPLLQFLFGAFKLMVNRIQSESVTANSPE